MKNSTSFCFAISIAAILLPLTTLQGTLGFIPKPKKAAVPLKAVTLFPPYGGSEERGGFGRGRGRGDRGRGRGRGRGHKNKIFPPKAPPVPAADNDKGPVRHLEVKGDSAGKTNSVGQDSSIIIISSKSIKKP